MGFVVADLEDNSTNKPVRSPLLSGLAHSEKFA
jgi:hypothetical protein